MSPLRMIYLALAIWGAGDPYIDFDGETRPNQEGATDFAGATRP